ncbi:MAG: alanine dehydrogenase [Burkholderiales bacterium]|jgi:alanine dehydrogenase|nr:alanine dehydrogenase [Burkholderiales bacterium]
MLIGVPKEIKNNEYRVGLTPSSVREAVAHGHRVIVETRAGEGIRATDDEYRAAGAEIAASAEEVFARAEMIVKVKEPQAVERKKLRPGQILFTYLHLAPDPEQAKDLVASGAVGIAYETVTSPSGGLPLLAPMSEVAGRMSVQIGARFLERPQGGRGVLLSGVPGVAPGKVVILGAGVVGTNAAYVAAGMGAEVILMDRSPEALRRAVAQFGPRVKTVYAARELVEEHVSSAHVVVGAALVPGALAPKLVTRTMLPGMKRGAVLVDVSIDQGGAFETSRVTTHSDPVFELDGVVHYGVANMPGAVPRTSAFALNNATIPYVLEIADRGWKAALDANEHLRNGLNVAAGRVTHPKVAEALGLAYTPPLEAIAAA